VRARRRNHDLRGGCTRRCRATALMRAGALWTAARAFVDSWDLVLWGADVSNGLRDTTSHNRHTWATCSCACCTYGRVALERMSLRAGKATVQHICCWQLMQSRIELCLQRLCAGNWAIALVHSISLISACAVVVLWWCLLQILWTGQGFEVCAKQCFYVCAAEASNFQLSDVRSVPHQGVQGSSSSTIKSTHLVEQHQHQKCSNTEKVSLEGAPRW
jgi:hypothetical protein